MAYNAANAALNILFAIYFEARNGQSKLFLFEIRDSVGFKICIDYITKTSIFLFSDNKNSLQRLN